MRSRRLIHTIDTHTEGQPTRIVVGGVAPVPGHDMAAKRDHIARHHDRLRSALLAEPRGHRDMYGCILTAPVTVDADLGVVYLHNGGTMDMCGHATIGLATALVETGMVPVVEPETVVVLDTPAGLVRAVVRVEGGAACSVTFANVPAWVGGLDVPLEVDGIGELRVDIAYGGNLFAVFRAADAGIELAPDRVTEAVDVGIRVLAAAARCTFPHPASDTPLPVNIATAVADGAAEDVHCRNLHVFGPGQFDRSPGGTGTTAQMAIAVARGKLRENERFVVESPVTGGTFTGQVDRIEAGAGRQIVHTRVTGRAFLTGLHQLLIDPDDPLAAGFLVPPTG